MDPTDPFDAPAFHRTGNSNPLGKNDTLVKVYIDAESAARLQVVAAQEGVSLSELGRVLMQERAWGAEHLASLEANRIKRITGKGA